MYDIIITLLLWTAIICLVAASAGFIADHMPWSWDEARQTNDRWFNRLLDEDDALVEEHLGYGGHTRVAIAVFVTGKPKPTLASNHVWLAFTMRRKWLQLRWYINYRIEDFILGHIGRPASEVIQSHLHPMGEPPARIDRFNDAA